MAETGPFPSLRDDATFQCSEEPSNDGAFFQFLPDAMGDAPRNARLHPLKLRLAEIKEIPGAGQFVSERQILGPEFFELIIHSFRTHPSGIGQVVLKIPEKKPGHPN